MATFAGADGSVASGSGAAGAMDAALPADDQHNPSPVGELLALDEGGATIESRALFARFSKTVLIGGETDRTGEFLSASYVEHHGSGATGPSALAAFLEAERATYTRIHHVIADGNYVFALSEGMRDTEAGESMHRIARCSWW